MVPTKKLDFRIMTIVSASVPVTPTIMDPLNSLPPVALPSASGTGGFEASSWRCGGGDVSGENEPEEENIDYDALFLEFETDTFGLEVGHDFDGDDEEVTDVIVDDDSIGLLDYTNDPQHAGIAGWLESMSSI